MTSYDALLATLAAYAYQTNRRVADRITLPLPLEVTRVASATDSASGFEAYAFRYQGQTIIAFSGTAPGLESPSDLKDWFANFALGYGQTTAQLRHAAVFYQQVKAAYGDNVVFTGHSLGGGLAALMGVFFDKQAITFDPAQFRMAATVDIARVISDHLVRSGYGTDPDLAGFWATTTTVGAAVPDLVDLFGGWTSAGGLAVSGMDYPTSDLIPLFDDRLELD